MAFFSSRAAKGFVAIHALVLYASVSAADSTTTCRAFGTQMVCDTFDYGALLQSCARSNAENAQVQLLISRLVHDEVRALQDAERHIAERASTMTEAELLTWRTSTTARGEIIRIASEWLDRAPSHMALTEWERRTSESSSLWKEAIEAAAQKPPAQ